MSPTLPSHQPFLSPLRGWIGAALVVWLVVIVGGFCRLAVYANQAGAISTAPARIPDASAAREHRSRLVMFAHPHCPCTAASLGELARIMSRCSTKLDAVVYFYRPLNESDDWVFGDLQKTAAAIPGVRIEVDPAGEAAKQFGARTSGDVLLYDDVGQLTFHGGITGARGHEGDNSGKSAVIAAVLGEGSKLKNGPVFGCSLLSKQEAKRD